MTRTALHLRTAFLLSFLFLFSGAVMAQHGSYDEYVPVTDPLVKKKLDAWQDLKLGLFMHWGTYCQWGVVESWSLCNEEWCGRRQGRCENYAHYKEDYRNLRKTFNPVDFEPGRWVEAAQEAGMKYLVFTTKHHDGFCMFDSRLTDYKITSEECPFHTHPNADVTAALFHAFREAGFMIGAYFSKPDWDCHDYWWPYHATPDRHVNYDPARHPERWERFKAFTRGQIEELMTRYGRIDMLWLDGAWVRPIDNMPDEYREWALKNDWNQDIDMATIANLARDRQPGLIVVDRWVSGEFENYLTPEQKIPEEPILVPWESCITMAPGWSYNEHHEYKSVRTLVRMLVETVSRGGNLLLNIGPSPRGDWAPDAYDRLKGLGAWLRVNGEAIYGTRPVKPYADGKVRLTRGKDGAVHAIYLPDEGEEGPPATIELKAVQPAEGAAVTLLGHGTGLSWEAKGAGCVVHLPETFRDDPPCRHAWTVTISRRR